MEETDTTISTEMVADTIRTGLARTEEAVQALQVLRLDRATRTVNGTVRETDVVRAETAAGRIETVRAETAAGRTETARAETAISRTEMDRAVSDQTAVRADSDQGQPAVL